MSTKTEENPFKIYEMYVVENGKIIDVNPKSIETLDESFKLFKQLFNTEYGSLLENDNLISIHTGGWSDNEHLVSQFKRTAWWFRFHKITSKGGHYYFNTDVLAKKEWRIQVVIN